MSNLRLGIRLGDAPLLAVTTTPRNVKPLRDPIKTPGTRVTSASTYANRQHLAAQFLMAIARRMAGRIWPGRSWAVSCGLMMSLKPAGPSGL